jgi:TolB-like protein/DNA-binding SARP family transcriptional activator
LGRHQNAVKTTSNLSYASASRAPNQEGNRSWRREQAMSMPSDSGIGAGSHWSLRLLGGFELRTSAGERVALPGKRERLLLAYLALARDGRQTRAKLALLLWGDAADEASIDNLRTCLWSLRKALGDTRHRVLVSDGEDIVLDASCFEVDAVAFERCSAESGRAGLEAASRLYAGDLLDGLDVDSEDFEAWRRLEGSRYRDQAAKVLLRLMTTLAEAGETEHAIDTGMRLLRLEPLHEAAARRLMQLYRDSGRRGAAIDVYRTLEKVLRNELDTEPEAETRAVFAEIGRNVDKDSTPAHEFSARALGADSAVPEPATPRLSLRVRLRPAVVSAVLILVVAIAASWFLLSPSDTLAPAAGDAAIAEQRLPAAPISVVVLPFVNLSGDPGQEFFSDGMTEEVTAALVKVPGLRVVARTSAFQFKDPGQDVRMVAQSLGASHLVEGSVRRSGTRFRVNAQLVDAASGTNLWTESYEPEPDDLLAIQDDIANAIAAALRGPLGLQDGSQISSTHIGDLDTYQKFLRARTMVHQRGYGSLEEGSGLLEEVVAGNPDHAPAWAYLAQGYIFALNYHPAWLSGDFEILEPIAAASMPKAERAARRAVQLDPNLADGYALLGLTLELRGELAEAEDLYRQAMVLDPTNPDVLHFYSRLLAEVGRLEESLAMRQQLRALDPFVPVYNFVTAWLFWLNDDTDTAMAISDALPPAHRAYASPQLLAAVGRYEEAAELALNAADMFLPGVAEAVAGLLRSAPTEVASPEALPRLGWFTFVYLHVGASERTLEFYEDGVAAGYSVSISNALLWQRYYASLRQTERYKNFMRNRGVVEYWRERGWPELCRPLGVGQDFTCD